MNVQRYTLATRDYGSFKILRPVPRHGDPWGDLAPLKGTPWEPLVPVVSGEVFSHALHGYAKPLMGVIGPTPGALLRKVPDEVRLCSLRDECVMYLPERCHPCKKLPECYRPDGPGEARLPASVVALAWAEDRYVVVVQGAEFSL